jgi:hypothetical protein
VRGKAHYIISLNVAEQHGLFRASCLAQAADVLLPLLHVLRGFGRYSLLPCLTCVVECFITLHLTRCFLCGCAVHASPAFCAGARMQTTVNNLDKAVLGTCARFEERQVGTPAGRRNGHHSL